MNDLANPLHQLRTLVDDAAMLTDPERIAPMLRDHRALYRGHALAVVAPADTAAVARVLAFCNEHRIGVVPQGGNTSYCGGATPDASSSQVLLSLARLNRVRGIDAANYTMTAEAGCILAKLQAAAAEADRYLPLSLGSEGSCMLGGNLSTNAGGLNVIRYGMARELVLGLEVVLADGRVHGHAHRPAQGQHRLRHQVAVPRRRRHARRHHGRLHQAVSGAALARHRVRRGARPGRRGVVAGRAARGERRLRDLVRADPAHRRRAHHAPHSGRRRSARRRPRSGTCCANCRPRAPTSRSTRCSQKALEPALTKPAGSATPRVAQNEREREAFWRLRESIPEAQRKDGASLKHDISVPVSQVPRFIEVAGGWVAQHIPQGVLVAYGHLGDGNLHFNINQRAGHPGRAAAGRGAEGEARDPRLREGVRRQLLAPSTASAS